MAKDTQTLKGLDNTLAVLNGLPPELVSKRGGVVLSALRKGGAVMRREIKEQIQRIIDEPNKEGSEYLSTGFLVKSITSWRSRRPQRLGGSEVLSVGPRSRATYPDGTRASMVLGVLENGTEHMPAKAPVRKAFDAKKQEALDAVVKGANAGIERALKKLDKRR